MLVVGINTLLARLAVVHWFERVLFLFIFSFTFFPLGFSNSSSLAFPLQGVHYSNMHSSTEYKSVTIDIVSVDHTQWSRQLKPQAITTVIKDSRQ